MAPLKATRSPALVSSGTVAGSLLSSSPLCVFTDSDSEHSGLEVSCSLEDGKESRSELYCSVRSYFGGRMSQEDRRGDEEEEDEGTRVNGVKKHR